MPAPTLTPQETAQLTQDKATQTNTQNVMNAALPAQEAKSAQYLTSDGAFKKFFDYYNTDIISEYDAERKSLNGQYIANPISEADIIGPANLDGTVRTIPTYPTTNIIRVAEFDGGPLITTPTNESQHIAAQTTLESELTAGFGSGHYNPLTAKTTADLTSSSTTLMVTDSTNPLTIAINDIILVEGVSTMALMLITSVTATGGSPPPYNFTYGITFIIPPTGTIISGTSLSNFAGFTNSERTSKTASDTNLQPLMNYFVTTLQTLLGDRQARLAEQLTALAANQDPDGVANIATATTNVNTSNSFLTTYLVTTDISDTGLASLEAETTTRSGQITTRLAQINAAYTGQTQNYYNERYIFANNRANTLTGTLRLYYASQASVAQLGVYAAGAAASIAAINSILP